MMNIGIVSTRLAGVDGVSLEVAKLVTIFRRMGHEVFYCAGELQESDVAGTLVPEMHFIHSAVRQLHDEAFASAEPPRDLFKRIYALADKLREAIGQFVAQYNIDLLMSQNASAIPMNIPLGVALRDYVARARLPLLCHNHDFYWERERFMVQGIQDILDDAFPPALEPIHHLVISSVARRELLTRRGIHATYLPNIFDFATPPPGLDDYSCDFREKLGIAPDDLLILQPTRMIRRKAIERAIELVEKLDDPRAVLVFTGDTKDEPGGYGDWLAELAARARIRCIFAAGWIDDLRGERSGHKVYSLWDVYPHADFITYPSVIEGFGNALIEMVYFRKPFIVHTYPVYRADIAPAGIKAVEFNYDLTPAVVQQVRDLLHDRAAQQAMTDHNYEVGRQCFSYEVAGDILRGVLNKM